MTTATITKPDFNIDELWNESNKLYLCHAYGRRHGLTDDECQRNVDASLVITRKLIQKGYNVLNPLLWHYIHLGWKDSPDENKYFELVSSWISSCQSVFVGKIPTYPNNGVEREIRIAEGKKIYYDMDEIP
jgi:hypothetical protein